MTVKPRARATDADRPASLPLGEALRRALPPLESGDRLTRAEFERRYQAMPHVKIAELIEGVVYMPSPVRFRAHALPHSWVIAWLGTYCAATPGVQLGDNATLRLDMDNEVQPDALLRLEPEAGGRSHVSPDDYLEGVPELIFEIATSSAAYDLHDKLNAYRRNGVPEYVIWQVSEGQLNWLRWEEGRYIPVEPDAERIIRSQVFPGLYLATAALLAGDLAQVLAVLQLGLQSEEHRVFAAKLAAIASSRS
jgi:Uma2 family endonuclease